MDGIVPMANIWRDYRFSLQNNWELIVIPAIKEAQERGVLVTPLTVFDYGTIVGWYLHGWVPPPSKITYIEEFTPPSKIMHMYIPDYSI